MRPLAEVNWLPFVVILRIVSGKLEVCKQHYKKKTKKKTEAGLKRAHMINKAVLLKWNVANGGGRGLRGIVGGGGSSRMGGCCHGF